MWHDFSLRCTTAVFVYLTHSPVISQFETALLRPRGRMMAGTRAPPPKSGGSLSSSFIPAGRLGTLVHNAKQVTGQHEHFGGLG